MSRDLSQDLIITLTNLRAHHDGAEMELLIRIDAGGHSEQKALLIATEQYCRIKPSCGTITAEAFEMLEAASELYAAIKRGESMLSYASNSARMLTQKLIRRGYSREVAEQATEYLCSKGLINEPNDMEREVERCLCKLWGAARIRSHLWSRGFGNEAMSELPTLLDEVDFSESCATLIRKKYRELPTDAAERRRMIASLIRYGYSMSDIKEAMKILLR